MARHSPYNHLEVETESETILTHAIEDYHESVIQTEGDLQRKIELKDQLQRLLQTEVHQKLKLFFYGSTIAGFAVDGSDIDLTLNVDRLQTLELCEIATQARYFTSGAANRQDSNKQVDAEVLQKVYKAIRQGALNISDLEFVNSPKILVPFVRGKDDVSGFFWQITSSNNFGVRNAKLQKMYSQADPRLIPLVIIVRAWADKQGVNVARNRLPNNYCWYLLVVYYLQAVVRPPVLPCLHKTHQADVTRIEADDTPIPAMDFPRSENTQSLGQLLIGFFRFYAENITCGQVFSIREAKLLNKRMVRSRPPARQWECRLLVEDPTSLGNVPRSVFDGQTFVQLVSKIKTADECLKNGATLEKLLQSA